MSVKQQMEFKFTLYLVSQQLFYAHVPWDRILDKVFSCYRDNISDFCTGQQTRVV